MMKILDNAPRIFVQGVYLEIEVMHMSTKRSCDDFYLELIVIHNRFLPLIEQNSFIVVDQKNDAELPFDMFKTGRAIYVDKAVFTERVYNDGIDTVRYIAKITREVIVNART